ncbi:hypothetical protein I315_06529 [Cryptococcus gattii Ru294]|uniref:Uncharacterized protein n=2 Tax=Cryptococcus gattii TaxID=37769 RepID=E6QXP8_CRYGW|nr:Hypothetical Protein CGB_A4390W [Cryptococcus gattii WM276]KIR51069.1 hypothetical protein I315_06529 [Cryptococcus gattii Ru294]KIR79723.1 hypothetical protein I306_03181 [Cryptococcus gattii EJB2]KIY37016.1 hypothetical protein I305_00105 [Cryptococcus gattii E566]KJE02736.1 hypothetical protein I311_03477 [Cryptococcus gattii NT-10]ADV19609.1 Hypothetical Protein CGB_A4390W [Cryptococcus gattii WM276]
MLTSGIQNSRRDNRQARKCPVRIRRSLQKTKPPPDKEEDPMITKLREKLKLSLQEVRKNAE